MSKPLILLSLNELNFEFVEDYISKGYLPNFRLLFEQFGYQKTSSEREYHLLEPWIQWVSVHTGKTFEEHKVFRLGDIADRDDLDQIWEVLERRGYKVAAISPFNAKNNLKKAPFFVPDPWTITKVSGEARLEKFYKAISKIVNNHSNGEMSGSAPIDLFKGFLSFIPFRSYTKYFKLATRIRRKSTKVTILDELLSDIFFHFYKKEKPDFSSLFLNGAAHIQHHYMFNSKAYSGDQSNPEWYCPKQEDPVLDILNSYDLIIKKLLSLDARVIFATGLHQKPHKSKTYYWRLKDHESFLKLIGINNHKSVLPRMSRDWLIEFNDFDGAREAEYLLNNLFSEKDNLPLFSVDNRGESLFVELVYPQNITKNFSIISKSGKLPFDFFEFVSFLAIKNGEHDGVGYMVDTDKNYHVDNQDYQPVTNLFERMLSHFGIPVSVNKGKHSVI